MPTQNARVTEPSSVAPREKPQSVLDVVLPSRNKSPDAVEAADNDDDDDLNPDARPKSSSSEQAGPDSSNANDETISSSPMQRSFLHLMRIVRPLLLFLGISAAFACILSFLEGANELRSLEIAAADWDRHQTQLSTSSATIRASLHGNADGLASLEVLLDRLNQLEASRPVVKNKNWTFIGSLYFVFTVSTTIGYGTFAPVTTLGRAFTVIACFVGIGSFIRILAQICPVYSHYFRKCSNLLLDYLIEHPQEGDWLARLDENDRGVVRALTTFVVNLTMGLALVLGFGALFEFLAAVEGDTWGFWECVYFAVVTLTTVGLGDHSLRWYGPTAIFEISMFVLFTIIGLAIMQELILSWVVAFNDVITAIHRRCKPPSYAPTEVWDVAGDERMERIHNRLTRQINYLRIHGLVDLPDADDILSGRVRTHTPQDIQRLYDSEAQSNALVAQGNCKAAFTRPQVLGSSRSAPTLEAAPALEATAPTQGTSMLTNPRCLPAQAHVASKPQRHSAPPRPSFFGSRAEEARASFARRAQESRTASSGNGVQLGVMNFDVERSSVEYSASDSKMAKLNDKLKVELERVRREAEQRERRLLEAMEALEEKINDASERNSRRRRSKKEAAEKPNATTESSNWYDVPQRNSVASASSEEPDASIPPTRRSCVGSSGSPSTLGEVVPAANVSILSSPPSRARVLDDSVDVDPMMRF